MSNPESDNTSLPIRDLPIGSLQPNPWNPNKLTAEEFQQYVDEVNHLGRLPKPIVVRPLDGGERFQILDGEQGWRIAQTLGFKLVPCEVIEANDLDAMTQTLKRNQHGTHDQVLEGRMLAKMQAIAKIEGNGEASNVALAAALGISESKVRTSLLYLKAADLRLEYHRRCREDAAGVENESQAESSPADGQPPSPTEVGDEFDKKDRAKADGEIAKLTNLKVRLYLALHSAARDPWVDAKANERDLQPYLEGGEFELAGHFVGLAEAGLAKFLDRRAFQFGRSLDRMVRLGDWCQKHEVVQNVAAYTQAVAEAGMDVEVLEALPLVTTSERISCPLSLEQWEAILAEAQKLGETRGEVLDLIMVSVRVALRELNVDFADVFDPRIVEKLQILNAAPDFLQGANHLTLDEQVELQLLSAAADEALALVALRRVCDLLAQERTGQTKRKRRRADPKVRELFSQVLKSLQSPSEATPVDAQTVMGQIRHRVVAAGGVTPAAADVLAGRLQAIPEPELVLIDRLLSTQIDATAAITAWATAVEDLPATTQG